MICLQTDQSKVKFFFDVIVRLTGFEKTEILNRETYNICTLTNKRRFVQVIFSTQSSAVQVADCCRKNTQRIHHYFKIELFEKTENKNENRFHQRKAAEGDYAPCDQPGTVRLVSSISRPMLLIGGRLVGRFLRLVLLAPVVVSCST